MSEQETGIIPDGANEGTNEGTNPLHEDFINSAPEELRDAAAQLAPVWDQYVQGKFNEHAEARKILSQFDGIPLDQVTKEDIEDYLSFKEISSDPQKLYAWHQQWDANLREQHPELFGIDTELTGAPAYQNDPALTSRIEQLEAQLQADAQARREAEVENFINSEISQLKQQNASLTDDDIEAICTLASKYVPENGQQYPEDIIQKGYADYQKLVGKTERELFTKKENQPVSAMSGGRPNTAVSPITSFEAANEAARRAVIESMKA